MLALIVRAAMRGWFAGFDQRITLSPACCLLSAAVAVVVSTATVAARTLPASRAAPAWA